MHIHDVARIFDDIEQESSRTVITQKLAEIFSAANSEEAQLLAYLCLGSLFPPYKNIQFNIAEKTLVAVVAGLCDRSIEDLIKELKKIGDIGLLATQELHAHRGQAELTIKKLYAELYTLASTTGSGSQEHKEKQLIAFLSQLDPRSIKYVLRVLVGDLRLGFSDMTLLDAFSWSVTGTKKLKKELEHAYNVSADIGQIIATLKTEGIEGVQKMVVTPGIPVRPAAAERLADAQEIIKKLGPCVVQPKLDGLRLQLHLFTEEGERKVRFFSRNLKDMSDMFPEFVSLAKQITTRDLIAEGEALAFDPETHSFLPFQETSKRRRKHDVAEAAESNPLKLFLFDLLYLGNQDLLALTHEQRREKLLDLLKTPPTNAQGSSIDVVEERVVETGEALSAYFLQNISEGLEGVVVKKPDASYQPGTRNFNWVKLKREESGSLDDTLDCVIVGYYAGHGKRASFGIGAFLIAVYNPTDDSYETIAKIGTGLTDAGWKEVKTMCDAEAIAHKSPRVVCAKELTPDVWVSPHIVCSIRADEITKSPLHTAGKTSDNLGFALRFPRIMGYRPDKGPADATTIKEVASLYDLQFQKAKKKFTAR